MADATRLLTEMVPRAQRLGLVDMSTGMVDQAELLTYLGVAVRYLATCYQLQMFLRINRQLFVTQTGVERYQLPDNYGYVAPLETYRSGLLCNTLDGLQPTNLEYYDPARYNLLRTPANTSKPAWFTLTQGQMWLQPIPDQVYAIEAVEKPTQSGDGVAEAYVAMVEAETLYRMAADQGRVVPELTDERGHLTRSVVNNEARQRQRFYTARERVGRGRYRRYGL